MSRAIDPDEPAGKLRFGGDGFVDPLRQALEVRVERTRDNARVLGPLTMQANEMPAVERQKRSALTACGVQHGVVGHSLASLACFVNRQHVVPQPPRRYDYAYRPSTAGSGKFSFA